VDRAASPKARISSWSGKGTQPFACSISPTEHRRYSLGRAKWHRPSYNGSPLFPQGKGPGSVATAPPNVFTQLPVMMRALGRRLFLEIESYAFLCRAGFTACMVILALAALLPADVVIRSEFPGKLEHFAAYSGTAVMCGFGFSSRPYLIGRYLLLVLWAGGLEAAQTFSPGRHAAVSDFGVSALGIVCGATAWWLAKRAVHGSPVRGT
jgi:VanZ family protein